VVDQLRAHLRLAASLPHGAEIALRAWGTVNPAVQAAVHEVDELRVAGLAGALVEYGLEPALAARYSRLTLAALTGAQLTMTPVTEEHLSDLLGLLLRDIADELDATRDGFERPQSN
jgi:hypothetical protein